MVPPDFLRLAAHPVRWRLMSALAVSDLRVRELVGQVGEPQNLVSYHLRLLRDGGLVTATRSSLDGRDSYYHLELDRCADGLARSGGALHPALVGASAGASPQPAGPVTVLFVCTGNSARSPIAEVLLRGAAGGWVEVTSAGSHPKPTLHPQALRVLRERCGIDLGAQRPRHLESLAGRRFDVVVTLCDKAREVCPEFGDGSRRIHWSIADPAAGRVTFDRTADDIETRIRHLLPILAT
ncbi:arsenate reductase/protein-tyrosine-phosphatase family protein [Asanoa iriomotensis]|uniref:arsenate reductase/protein-tyrosine-phosphatase family protein n=1 Tax=Asanoa iriomotensis TaxID=234613 RepID=UPI001EF1940F|nr:ArsR family transcriptional regulator [Asanoa iriomotensis]